MRFSEVGIAGGGFSVRQDPLQGRTAHTKCGLYLLATSLAAAVLDGHFEQPASGLEGVEMVDQLTQPARAPAVGSKGQPRQVPQIRFVELFWERAAQFEGALG